MPPTVETIAQALAPWFEREQRDLSFRRTRDPYAIWVSEIMLQQTRVETVEGYYAEFLRRFPDPETLAAADEDAVLSAWSGLGYYRRARLLHRGARHVVAELGGELPRTASELRGVPGIGRYTAGAIASIAFDEPAPLVDGNVARVLSRLFAIEDPGRQDAGDRRHWQRVEQVLSVGSPRVLAQALMELGATVCTPKSPRCPVCPLRDECEARAHDMQHAIPAPRKRIPQPEDRWCALAVRWRDRLMLVRRPDEGLLARMWCLPLVRIARRGKAPRTPPRAHGLDVDLEFDDAPTKPVRHVFSHRIWDLHPWRCTARRKPRPAGHGRARIAFIAEGQRPDGGIPNVTEKLLRRVGF